MKYYLQHLKQVLTYHKTNSFCKTLRKDNTEGRDIKFLSQYYINNNINLCFSLKEIIYLRNRLLNNKLDHYGMGKWTGISLSNKNLKIKVYDI